jgi:glycosyltransferase involved in cell wall biosynthesis
MAKVQDSLTVVLPSYNDAVNLPRRVHELLEFLPELTPRFDILIVDTGSSDSTDEVACELERDFPQLQLSRQTRRTTTDRLATLVYQHSTSDFVALVRENARVSTVQLQRLWARRRLAQSRNVAAGGHEPSVIERLKSWASQLASPEPRAAEPEIQMICRRHLDGSESQLPRPRLPRGSTPATHR